MERTYWHKQSAQQALFPDLTWSRPENKASAGKLLIIGGNQYGFVAPSEAFKAAEVAGAGTVRMILPDSLKQFVGPVFEAGSLVPSTASGSFSKAALGEWTDQSAWADGVLLAGDFGRNSETAALLESFLSKHVGQVTITQDAADYILSQPELVLNRPNTSLVITLAQLQKIASGAKFEKAFTLGMDLMHVAENLHEFTLRFPVNIITKQHDQLVVGLNGQISTTKLRQDKDRWRVQTAAHTSVWWLQNPAKPFEALTTAIHEVL
ncbi:MAG TPA: hypothetical protein VM124_00935 [Candidatus Limnocylindrales bacterium]|nr:hypothetical protein [Candidatus Limnocylindrales bacterium]